MYNCKEKHPSTWIIHINLKWFAWEKNFSWDKRIQNVYMIVRESFYGKIQSAS